MNKAPERSRIAASTKDKTNIAAMALPFDEMKNNPFYLSVFDTCHKIAKNNGKLALEI